MIKFVFFCVCACNSKVVFFPLQLFALLGFVVSAVLISAAASEVVSLLHMLGVVLSLSNTVLGLTLLAWGNSIGGDICEPISNNIQKLYMLVLENLITPLFQTLSLTSPSPGRVTHGWPYLPVLEASFSVSLFFYRSVCRYKNITYGHV